MSEPAAASPYVERTVDECLRARRARRELPYRVATANELRLPLEAWLREEIDPAVEVGALVRAPGGTSKENFFFDLLRPTAGAAAREALLLRLDPGESIVETHRRREFEILRAVAGVVPAPRAIAVDAAGSRLGRPALVMERVAGRSQPEVGGRPGGAGITFESALRASLADQFLEALVRLHTIDWRSRDLGCFDAPRPGTTEAAAWSLAWWERVWEEDRVEDHPVIVLAAEWLRAHLPTAERIVLVHGDYRSGNFLYDDAGRITAILDWELAHLGDPHEDLGWIVNRMFATRHGSEPRLACGLWPREQALAGYERATGWRIDPARLRFYELFSNYKLAVCAHTTTLRIARGERTHVAASMSLIHAFAHLYIAELARALGIGESTA
jgi:aminoglycoside phosphotransferase (APT) family kinase protein